jgi:ligand-binding SRPBCC domain-containing protein
MGKTRLTDEISFALPGGQIAEFLGGWLVQLQLEAMFRYRHHITKQECESGNFS